MKQIVLHQQSISLWLSATNYEPSAGEISFTASALLDLRRQLSQLKLIDLSVTSQTKDLFLLYYGQSKRTGVRKSVKR